MVVSNLLTTAATEMKEFDIFSKSVFVMERLHYSLNVFSFGI
jgi:hypothetical protein